MQQVMPRIKQLKALGSDLLAIWVQALLLTSCASVGTCCHLSVFPLHGSDMKAQRENGLEVASTTSIWE